MSEKNLPDWYNYYLPGHKEILQKEEGEAAVEGVRENSSVYEEVDLHGLTLTVAKKILDQALKDTLNKGIKKLLVIHGKGLHSEGEAVLKKGINDYLDAHPLAGKKEKPPAKLGGSGALMVWVRQKESKK